MPKQMAKTVETEKENLEEMMINVAAKKRKLIIENNTSIEGCKVIMFPNGAIQINSKISELIKLIKPFIIHFLDSSASLKLWIQILIPQVEDFKAELSLQIQVIIYIEII